MKIKWKVAAPPVGRYRSFEKRGWPTAYYKDGKPAVFVHCKEAYLPADVKAGKCFHFEVSFCHHNHAKAGNSWTLLKASVCCSFKELQDRVQRKLEARPEYAPRPKAPPEAVPARCCANCAWHQRGTVRGFDESFDESRCSKKVAHCASTNVCALFEVKL